MKKVLWISVILFLASACQQMPAERNHVQSNNSNATAAANQDNAETESKIEVERIKEYIVPPAVQEAEANDNDAVKGDNDFDTILTLLREIDSLLCENECKDVSSLPPNQTDASRLRSDIDMALKGEGLNGVYTQVDNDLYVTMRGMVNFPDEKNKAYAIAAAFKDVRGFKDMIFVVQNVEENI
jgi:hypothetical protein